MDKTIIKEYDNALWTSINGHPQALEDFKNNHSEEYKIITAMYRKRVAINDTLRAMSYLNEPMYWFTLTFNNTKDNNSVEWKRKEAQYFLNEIAPVYVMVEEYGEDNNRYHIHGFLIFRYGKSWEDFRLWHSRQSIEELTEKKIRKKVRYLTKYAVKSVPRIRRSKMASNLYTSFLKHKVLTHHFECLMKETMKEVVDSKINLF